MADFMSSNVEAVSQSVKVGDSVKSITDDLWYVITFVKNGMAVGHRTDDKGADMTLVLWLISSEN